MANEQNEQVVRRNWDAWNGDQSAIEETVAADAVGHDPAMPEETRGPDGVREMIAMYRGGFPDLEFTIEEMISDGDLVATRWSSTGTHTGDLQGAPPTGQRVTVTGMSIDRVENGKIVEAWAQWDNAGLAQALGAAQEAAATAG
jgi:steroid delta-isomerase-like uncharacterized protein